MMKITLVAAAMMLPMLAGATTPAPAPAPQAATAAPQSTHATSRSQALKLMATCQKKAKGLMGAEKEKFIQACMRPGN